MRIPTGLAAAAIAAALSQLVLAVPASSAPPVEAFANLPLVRGMQISPDGKYVAVIQPIDGRPVVTIYDLTAPGAKLHSVGLQEASAEEVSWKGDRLICIFRSNRKEEFSKHIYQWTRAISVTPDAQNAVLLMHDLPFLRGNPYGSLITDLAPDDPTHVYIAVWVTNAELENSAPRNYDQQFLNLFRVDVNTGNSEMVAHGESHTIDWIMDGHGHPIGSVEQDQDLNNHIMVAGKDVGTYSTKGGSELTFEGWTDEAKPSLVISKAGSTGRSGLYRYQLGTGVGAALFANPTYDLNTALIDPNTQKVIGASYVDDKVEFNYFDPAIEKMQQQLEADLPGQSVALLSWDSAMSVVTLVADGPQQPPVYYIFRPATGKLSVFAAAYPNLTTADLGVKKPYPYKSGDGLDIHAYLTLPPGRDPHNLPTVILPHGGPEDRDDMNFDWIAQFLANRGYVVLQPNFRGSSGYGWDFISAGDGEWARKVQDDVVSGVKKLIADGISDPKRICIVGASYGGYMALAGATFSPDLYACAVSYAGISDVESLYYTGSAFDSEGASVWKRRVGVDLAGATPADDQSPSRHADRVKAPILLIHSDKDVTVNIEQSQQEESALKSAGKSVEFVTLEGDDHQLTYAVTRIRFANEIQRFLAAHIGN